jgi:hypothetical protein
MIAERQGHHLHQVILLIDFQISLYFDRDGRLGVFVNASVATDVADTATCALSRLDSK